MPTTEQREAELLARIDAFAAKLASDETADPMVREFLAIVSAWVGLSIARQLPAAA